MIKKLITSLILVVILFGGTSVAFSYWDNLQQTENVSNVSVGEGVTLELDILATVPNGKVLVPVGKAQTSDSVEEIVLTYNVYLDKQTNNDLDLTVISSNILIGGSSDHSDLVNIDISKASDFVNDSEILITVTISVDAPTSQEQYDAIKNQAVTFTLTFEASV